MPAITDMNVNLPPQYAMCGAPICHKAQMAMTASMKFRMTALLMREGEGKGKALSRLPLRAIIRSCRPRRACANPRR